MFSSFKEYHNDLIYSQRFYYNNYQYYNDYQKIEQKYKDDLSKVFFRINRKTKSSTIFFEWTNSNKMIEGKQNESSNDKYNNSSSMDIQSNSSQTIQQQNKSKNQQLGIEKLLAQVLDIFYQNNYSDLKNDEENKKQLFEFYPLKFRNLSTIQGQSDNNSLDSIDILNAIIKKQSEEKQYYYDAIEKLHQIGKQDDRMYLERWNAFQDFISYFLEYNLLLKEGSTKIKSEFQKLYDFATKTRFIIGRTLAANYSNSIFANLPNIKKINRVFHPLTLSLSYTNKFFEEQQGFKQKPRIVFLNLDGRQTPFNLRFARNMGQNFLYISIFKEPSYHYKKNQKMEQQFQSDIDTHFWNISDCFSRMMVHEGFPEEELFTNNEEKFINKTKMLLFPLNSDYLLKEHYKNQSSSSKKEPHINIPKLTTSEDIFFLFQSVIFQQIRYFNPQFIMVSYTGFIDLKQDHFNQIIKTLTIISDHKICLFPNFIDRLGKNKWGKIPGEQNFDEEQEQEQNQEQLQQQPEPEQQEDMDELKVRNIQVVQEFVEKYIPFHEFWPFIEHERILNNILTFLKVSAGTYSMQSRLLLTPYLKYSIGDRYSYLQFLGKCPQFKCMAKYSLNIINSVQLRQLFNNQNRIQLKQNRKQNEGYEKLIDSIINDFLKQQNRRQRFGNQYKLLYKLEEVLQEQQYETHLKYGNQESQSVDYSVAENSVTHFQTNRATIMSQYFHQMKKKLLLQNLQTYRHRKAFYFEQQTQNSHHTQQLLNRTRCYKFYLSEDDSEELFFEKYTQIIFDGKKNKVYIINYKNNDDRHLILCGNLNSFDKKIFVVKVQVVGESQRELENPFYQMFQKQNKLDSNQNSPNSLRKDLAFLNYSHCFIKNKLYLFWPQKWSIKDQIRHKLLNIPYKPQNVNIIVKIQPINEKSYVYETIVVKQNEKVYVSPKIGCSSLQIQSQEDQFFIFGGIQDNENDFFDIGQGVCHVQINQSEKYFTIKPLPKVKEKQIKQSSISMISLVKKNLIFSTRIRPKMNYRIEKFSEGNSEENKLVISGGYGRQFTNFFNCFSYDNYLFNITTKQIQGKEMHLRRLIKFNKPISISKIGKYFLITNNQNIQEVQEKFSDLPKDLFVYEYKNERSGSNTGGRDTDSGNSLSKNQSRQIVSFLDERYRTNQFKIDNKKIYLFGFNRTIRQKIYTKFWSPELYILDGTQSNIVHISLKTQKNFNYNVSNFLMPRQQDIISLCLDQDRLYVLSSSPIVNSLQYTNNKYVLYEGSFANINDVTTKHELQMHESYQFKKQKQYMLKCKTLYAFQQKIYLFGGLATTQSATISISNDQQMKDINQKASYREDYILQKTKNKFSLKIRKVESIRGNVEMISPVVIRSNQILYFYSIELMETVVKKQGPFPEIKQNWKLKIETFISESSTEGKCMSQILKFYALQPTTGEIQRIIPRFDQPRFVSISKHEPFNMNKFKEYLQKVVIRLNKRRQLDERSQKIENYFEKSKELIKQKDEQLVQGTLLGNDKFFKQLIELIKPQINEKQKNLQQQQLLRDLKVLYSMVNKLIIQKLIQKVGIQDSSSQTVSNTGSEIKREKFVYQKLQKLNINSQESSEYRFIVEDKTSRKIRYIAIGALGALQDLRFFRVRFRHDVCLCLNKTADEGFYYHPAISACEQIELADRFAQYDIMGELQIKNESKSFKQYKLYSQLKV